MDGKRNYIGEVSISNCSLEVKGSLPFHTHWDMIATLLY